jgi:hypothetical protein
MLKLLRSVNVKHLHVTGRVQTRFDDYPEAIPTKQLEAMAEACRHRIEPGVAADKNSAVILAAC